MLVRPAAPATVPATAPSTVRAAANPPAAATTAVPVGPIAWKDVIGVKAGTRPLLVWIGDRVADAAVERQVFADADVRLGARAFRVVRITAAQARLDPALAAHAAFAPTVVVLSPGLDRGSGLHGPGLASPRVLDALRTTAATYAHLDLPASIARARALIAEERALEAERATLRRTPPVARDTANRAAAVDARLTAVHVELDGLFTPRA